MVGWLLQRVLDQMAGAIALTGGDPAHDAHTRRQADGQIFGRTANDFVNVDGEPNRI
jgi:hypothetical protein